MKKGKFCFVLFLMFAIYVFTSVSSHAVLNEKSLVAYWPLDGDTKDITGKGSDGTIMGDPNGWTANWARLSCLNGKDDYVNVVDDSDQNKVLDLTKAITLMAWVKLEAETQGNPNFVAKDHAYFLGYLTGAKSLRHGVHTAGWNVQPSSEKIEDKVWAHACLTYDGKTMLYYKDGKETDNFNVSGNLNVEKSNFVIGTFQDVEKKVCRRFSTARLTKWLSLIPRW